MKQNNFTIDLLLNETLIQIERILDEIFWGSDSNEQRWNSEKTEILDHPTDDLLPERKVFKVTQSKSRLSNKKGAL